MSVTLTAKLSILNIGLIITVILRVEELSVLLEESHIITKINDYYLDETVNLDNILEHIFT